MSKTFEKSMNVDSEGLYICHILIGLQFFTFYKSPVFGIGVASARPHSRGEILSVKYLSK